MSILIVEGWDNVMGGISKKVGKSRWWGKVEGGVKSKDG